MHALLVALTIPLASPYVAITVIDPETGRGVPMVELKTVNNIRLYTDSAGRIAFHEPGLMNRQVYFHIKSHGYEYPRDGFGYRGKRFLTKPGSQITLKIKRVNLAERLYRVTGAGIYRDSKLLGIKAPIAKPNLNALVLGSDSVVNVVYRGRIYWFWGDTNRAAYPLGNFHVPGATSPLPGKGGLDPNVGINFNYFTNKQGFARPTARMPGDGPTWIDGLVVLKNGSQERLFAKYVKVRKGLKIYERGMVEFDPKTNKFVHRAKFDMKAPLYPAGHSFIHQQAGRQYVYFAKPYPFTRVAADPKSLLDLSRYECFTCVMAGSTKDNIKLDRDAQGGVRYRWRRNSLPMTLPLHRRLVQQGKLKANEALLRMRNAKTNKTIHLHAGSVHWNAYRKRWVMIANQQFGRSFLGEVWYSEAPKVTGPWRKAVRIVTHDKYSFYNPRHHPMFNQQGGRLIYFEGTYSHTFSGNKDQTPRYDYNQMMYRLDVSRVAKFFRK